MYIIIWRDKKPSAFIDEENGYITKFHSYDEAKKVAEQAIEENQNSEWYYDYQIYESVNK